MFEEKTQQLHRSTTIIDFLLIVGSYLLAYWVHHILTPESAVNFWNHIALIPFILAVWSILLNRFGAYRSLRLTTMVDYVFAVCKAVVVGLVLMFTVLFLLKIQYVSRQVVGMFAIVNVILLVGVRIGNMLYFRRALRRGDKFHQVLIIGTGNRAQRLARELREHTEWGIKIVGYLDPDPSRPGMQLDGASVLGGVDEITNVLKNHVVDEVILATPRAMIPDVDRIAQSCEEEGVTLRMMADVFDVHVARMRLVDLGSIPLLTLEPVAQDEWTLTVKRMIDLGAAILMMPVLMPLMAIIAIAVKLDSKGPVFFVQERVGLNKRRFPMFKFRTMVVGSEAMLKEIEHLNEAEGPIFKIKNDPRITRVGRFLRKSSLDEVPQILNIIRGEMSFVGPRPMSVRDVDLFDRGIQRKRFSVKPGITCLWQVSGRSELPFSKWLELDLEYIKNWSLALDLKILLKTIPVVLKGTGAV
jgi:exopolysaccharide biosynthesis polyprenyl glycosylphosphotransferase